jgi:hypothetical protein
LASGELELDCGKSRKWLLFDPNELQRFARQKGGIMKRTIVTLACLLTVPMAFAQTHSKRESQTTTEQPITVTGKTIMTSEGGSAASYQPFKTLVVNKDTPGRSQRTRSRFELQGRSDPDRDQTRCPRACLLCRHRRFTHG